VGGGCRVATTSSVGSVGVMGSRVVDFGLRLSGRWLTGVSGYQHRSQNPNHSPHDEDGCSRGNPGRGYKSWAVWRAHRSDQACAGLEFVGTTTICSTHRVDRDSWIGKQCDVKETKQR
jgi:hypothetical protein